MRNLPNPTEHNTEDHFKVMNTPSSVFSLICSFNQFSAADIDQRLNENKYLKALTEQKILYSLDTLPTSLLDLEPIETQLLKQLISRIRERVSFWLAEQGHQVFQLDQSSHEISSELPEKSSWKTLNKSTQKVYKISKIRGPALAKPAFNHPHLAYEKIIPLDYTHLLTLAPLLTDVKSLRSILSTLSPTQTLEAIKHALQGNLHLHQHGYAHGDIKTDNIIVELQDNQIKAQLADLESINHIENDGDPRIITEHCYEHSYYQYPQKSIKLTTDLFAWGVTLGEICTLANFQMVQRNIAEKQKSPDTKLNNQQIEQILTDQAIHYWRPEYPTHLHAIIQNLLKFDHQQRGSLQEIISAINLALEQIKIEQNNQKPVPYQGILGGWAIPISQKPSF